MFKKIISVVLLLFVFFISIEKTYAFCPVCTVAIGAGLGLSRWLKIDDIISGIWIGAFLVSSIGWTINYLNKKNIRFKGRIILITIIYYLLVILPLYYTNIIGHPYNQYLGIDKLVFGIITGTVVFLLGHGLHKLLMTRHHNKVYFPLQKVVIPLSLLIVTSIIFYYLIK